MLYFQSKINIQYYLRSKLNKYIFIIIEMITKISPKLPKFFRMAQQVLYKFSTNKDNNSQKKKPTFKKPLLTKLFLKRLYIKFIKNIKGYPFQIPFGKQTRQFLNKQQENDEQTPDNNIQNKNKIKWFLGTVCVVTLLFLLQGKKSYENLQKEANAPRYSRVLNENELFRLLGQGKLSQDIIIIRQNKSQIFYRDINYQNICLVKQPGRTQAIACMIINIPLFLQKLQKMPINYKVNFIYNAEFIPKQPSIMGNIIFFLLIGGFIYLIIQVQSKLMKGNFGQLLEMKKFEPIKPQNIKTCFKDVAGMHEAKQQITEFVDFLKNPDRYLEMGAKMPKGALLTGPPGTGKTLLARACAGQAGVPFFYVSGSQFVQKYVGLGANRIRSLFDSAKKAAPSIIFIDQIDAIGKKRSSGPFANEQRQNTLNQLLVNMDGFDTSNKVIVIAATNLKHTLDPALLRPGRFDRVVQISLPNFQERVQILQVHLKNIKLSKLYTIQQFAKKISIITPGFSGAQLANICNQAAILAARKSKTQIGVNQFQKATERILAGLQKRNIFSQQQKQCLAYYECGKAVAAWFTEGADPVIKISIAPYSKAHLGYSHSIKDQTSLRVYKQLLNKAACNLAGRTAEKAFKGYITSNGDSDLRRAKNIITYVVTKFGMSQIGNIGFPDIQYVRKPYSNYTEERIDKEIQRIYKQCQEYADKIVKEKMELIEKLKVKILQKQTLNHSHIKQILGDRPFEDNENYLRFLKDASEQIKIQNTPNISVSPQKNT